MPSFETNEKNFPPGGRNRENMRDIITVAARCEDTFMIAVEVQELRWDKNHFHN